MKLGLLQYFRIYHDLAPIARLIYTDFIRSSVQRWFYECRELHTATDVHLTEAVQVNVDEQTELSLSMTIHPMSYFEFEAKVRWNVKIVDIQEKKCSYRYF